MIVLDTGPLVALVNGRDKQHERCRDWFSSVRNQPLVIPAPVLGEAWYLIGKACGAAIEAQFLADPAAGAYGGVIAPTSGDLSRAGELVAQYGDLPLGGTDASVVATAERLQTTDVATLDHRHFRVVRPRHVLAFRFTSDLSAPRSRAIRRPSREDTRSQPRPLQSTPTRQNGYRPVRLVRFPS